MTSGQNREGATMSRIHRMMEGVIDQLKGSTPRRNTKKNVVREALSLIKYLHKLTKLSTAITDKWRRVMMSNNIVSVNVSVPKYVTSSFSYCYYSEGDYSWIYLISLPLSPVASDY